MIAEVKLFSGKGISVIEIEREEKAISQLLYFVANNENKSHEKRLMIKGLTNNNGVWNKSRLEFKSINYLTLRHGKRYYKHRADLILKKVV